MMRIFGYENTTILTPANKTKVRCATHGLFIKMKSEENDGNAVLYSLATSVV